MPTTGRRYYLDDNSVVEIVVSTDERISSAEFDAIALPIVKSIGRVRKPLFLSWYIQNKLLDWFRKKPLVRLTTRVHIKNVCGEQTWERKRLRGSC